MVTDVADGGRLMGFPFEPRRFAPPLHKDQQLAAYLDADHLWAEQRRAPACLLALYVAQ